MMATRTRAWDERAATAFAVTALDRIVAVWPKSLPLGQGEAGRALDAFEADVHAAIAAKSWRLLVQARDEFIAKVVPLIAPLLLPAIVAALRAQIDEARERGEHPVTVTAEFEFARGECE